MGHDISFAEKGKRTSQRLRYRNGYYSRTLVPRVGKLELRVLQDRHGRFRMEIFERNQRCEVALSFFSGYFYCLLTRFDRHRSDQPITAIASSF